MYAARVLGAAGYGAFAYAISLAGLLTIFADFGIGPVLTREAARAKERATREKILGTAFVIKIALLVLGVVVVLFAAPLFTTIHEAKTLLPVVAFVLLFDALREFGVSLIRALERMELEAGLYLFTNIAIVVLGFLFLKASPTPLSLTWAYALATGLGTVATAYILRAYIKNLVSNFYFKLIKPILASAWPFAFTSVLGAVMISTDILIIGFFRSAEEVGLYSAADRIIQLLYLLPVILATSTFPALARLAREESTKARALLEKFMGVAFLLSLPVALGGVVTARALILLLFGTEYVGAVLPFQILLVTLIFRFPAALLSNAVFAHDKEKVLITFAALAGISNLVLDLILIPRFGIIGSAWTTLFAQLLGTYYLWNAMKKIRPFTVLSRLPRMCIAAAVMGGGAWTLTVMGTPVLVTVALGGGIYVLLLTLFREPLLQEFKFILRSAA
jgi:O-antigen/teichoic acid export membrane protein